MKWIKVADQDPPLCVDILFTDGQRIFKGWVETMMEEEGLMFFNDVYSRDCDHWPDDITHWMSLPELPSESFKMID